MPARNLTRRRATFHSLAVREVRPLTTDSVEVTFAVPEELADDYSYSPGQYVALRAIVDGHELRRSYSICQAPLPGELRVAIKKDVGGIFSTWANDTLTPGVEIDVMSPEGTFTTDLDAAEGKHFAAIAAGSGITPVMSLARSILGSTDHARFTIVYSNRTVLEVMFLEDLSDLKDRYPARLALHHVLSREERNAELLSGRIDQAKLDAMFDSILSPESIDEWFLCGPFDLVDLARTSLERQGVSAASVHFELFTADRPGAASRGSVGRPVVATPGLGDVTIQFTLDGRTATVVSPESANESILNAALRVRTDVPFACAGGVCGTCRAHLDSGTVRMTENFALEPDELANGFVLTCQSHPTSEKVSVDYDA
jgi:ring-1,2-phenylacetyl-CoA epoxidase subunit PaaE